jgi:hypothetical protein
MIQHIAEMEGVRPFDVLRELTRVTAPVAYPRMIQLNFRLLPFMIASQTNESGAGSSLKSQSSPAFVVKRAIL